VSNIDKLYKISRRTEKLIVGLMSGTSLDGLDIALCRINGTGLNTKVSVEKFETIPYSPEIISSLRKISAKTIDLEDLCLWNVKLASIHSNYINNCLKRWKIKNSEVDLIASHGQTVYHCPASQHNKKHFGNSTLQIGDGDHIAKATGIITISDFRQKHIAAGGEGAPLAVYGDYLLFSNKLKNVLLINIGGIANITYLPKNTSERIVSTDVGPGNCLMDLWMRINYNLPYDKNGTEASTGNVNKNFLKNLERNNFFKLPFPKSTGNEIFNYEFILKALKGIGSISNSDIIATLNCFTFRCIKKFTATLPGAFTIYVSGGGIYNLQLMSYLHQEYNKINFQELNYPADAKEAVLFAVLANECVSGKSSVFKKAGVVETLMGKISLSE